MAEPNPADPPFNTIRYLPTNEAYDRWAEVYDSDGNFLQALDDIELKTLFPRFLAAIQSPKPWRLLDLGCGTGRNTALLLGVHSAAEVIALDASKGMLDVARTRLLTTSRSASAKNMPLRLELFDMLATEPLAVDPGSVDGIISTLVLEHVPLEIFFAHAARLLRPGGVLLLTNMHAQMGAVSQAGFVDAATGEKIRPRGSFAHAIEDVVREAGKCGFEVESGGAEDVKEGGVGFLERVVTGDLVESLGPRSRKWVGVKCWFGGVLRKMV